MSGSIFYILTNNELSNSVLKFLVMMMIVHGFLGLTSTKQWVNVTCSRPQQTVPRPGLEPGTPWSVVRDAKLCASPPHWSTIDFVENVNFVQVTRRSFTLHKYSRFFMNYGRACVGNLLQYSICLNSELKSKRLIKKLEK